MVKSLAEYTEELYKVMEKTTDIPTHFLIYYPFWGAMVKEMVDKMGGPIYHISEYCGLKPIIIGLEDIYSCSDNIKQILKRGDIVFLRIPHPEGMI